MPKRIITCPECEQTRSEGARGLCWPCWKKHHDAGTLDDFYPKLRRGPAPGSEPSRQRECPVCGIRHRARHDKCRGCYDRDGSGYDTAPDVPLIGGRWVSIRGVQRWLEDAA